MSVTAQQHQANTIAGRLLDTNAHLLRHDQEHFAFLQLTGPEQARQQLAWLKHYQEDLWAFKRDCVYTLDQVDSKNPIKPFPSDLEYLEFLTAAWLRHPLLAIPKSRRMTCSWSFISDYTWDTIFHKGRFNGFVSKKEDDAGELVSRAEFIYHKIPEWRIPRALLPKVKNGKMSKQPPLLEFEEINSKIQGFPQGADQLRQFTLSGILGDECAFWEKAREFYSATKPTTDGGGRITLISSRSPGFFKLIVFDKLDALDLNFPEEPPVKVKSPMEGVECWTNPQNGFFCTDLHYTANPAKRGPEWRDRIKASMPARDFAMEYERSWQTHAGKPVFVDYVRNFHSVVGKIEPEPGLPLLIGWDFGLTPAAIICQLVGKQLRVLKELLEDDGSIDKLAPVVWRYLCTEFPEWARTADTSILGFCDPNMNARKDTDERTCASVLRTNGFTRLHPGPVQWEPRRRAVESFLVRIDKGMPGLLVSRSECPVLQEGLSGGYQYPEKYAELEPSKITPLKNRFSHPHDALQYVCAGANQTMQLYGRLPAQTAPGYGFQKAD